MHSLEEEIVSSQSSVVFLGQVPVLGAKEALGVAGTGWVEPEEGEDSVCSGGDPEEQERRGGNQETGILSQNTE